MAFSQEEYKIGVNNPRIQGIIETFLKNSSVLPILLFNQVDGSAVDYTREKTLPTVGFRAINDPYTASEGEIEDVNEKLKILGGKMTVDRAILIMEGEGRALADIKMRLKAIARTFSFNFFKGDGTSETFSGLQTRIGVAQQVNNGTAPLSLEKLDDAVENCIGDNKAIFMNTKMYTHFKQVMRNPALAGNIMLNKSDFGKPVYTYGDIPIYKAGKLADDTTEILAFTEASTTTSIYVISLDNDEGVTGLQNGGPRDFNLDGGQDVANDYDIDWYLNMTIYTTQSAYRVLGITDGAITA